MKDNLATRFKNFSEATTLNWARLNVSCSRRCRKEQIHLATGLCGWAIKIHEQERISPNADGSPNSHLDFVASELRLGLDNLVRNMLKVEAPGGKAKTRSEWVW